MCQNSLIADKKQHTAYIFFTFLCQDNASLQVNLFSGSWTVSGWREYP